MNSKNLHRVDDWHLHLTVMPRDERVAGEYVRGCEKLRWKPTVIVNVPGTHSGGLVAPEQELIPTIGTHGELGQAIIALHDAAKFFVLAGWIVRRMKIEGRERSDEAMYCEAHVQVDPGAEQTLPVSRSLSSSKTYATVRSLAASDLSFAAFRGKLAEHGWLHSAKVEWTVYDNNRALDRPWFQSWGEAT